LKTFDPLVRVRDVQKDGQTFQVVSKRYPSGNWVTYRRRTDIKTHMKNVNETNAQRGEDQVNDLRPYVEIVQEAVDSFKPLPCVCAGFRITHEALRAYIAVVAMDWTQSTAAKLLDTNTSSVRSWIQRVENARDERWFDEALDNIEAQIGERIGRNQ
jgi:hypothetical protein